VTRVLKRVVAAAIVAVSVFAVAGCSSESVAPVEQDAAYRAAVEGCTTELGYDQTPVLTEEQRKRLYRGLLWLVDCLKDRGHAVEQVPSEQSSLDESAVFDPYGELRDPRRADRLSDETFARLLEVCPIP